VLSAALPSAGLPVLQSVALQAVARAERSQVVQLVQPAARS
jgi:hypothetical protein